MTVFIEVTTWAGLTVYVIYINEKNKTKCHAVGTVDIGRIDHQFLNSRIKTFNIP